MAWEKFQSTYRFAVQSFEFTAYSKFRKAWPKTKIAILIYQSKNPRRHLQMAKIQINDVNLDGAELFNDSETFLNELQDGEIEQVVGGLTKVAPEHLVTTTAYFPDKPYKTIHIPHRTIPIRPIEPTHPIKPVHPTKPVHPIKFPYYPHPRTPVIL